MTLKISKGSSFTVGAKETTKAIKNNRIEEVYIANDCDAYIVKGIVELCKEHNIPIHRDFSKEELGKKALIKVGAATVGVLK